MLAVHFGQSRPSSQILQKDTTISFPLKLEGVDTITTGRTSRVVNVYVDAGVTAIVAGDAVIFSMAATTGAVVYGVGSCINCVSATLAAGMGPAGALGIAQEAMPSTQVLRNAINQRIANGWLRVVVGGYSSISNSSAAGSVGDLLIPSGIAGQLAAQAVTVANGETRAFPSVVKTQATATGGVLVMDRGWI